MPKYAAERNTAADLPHTSLRQEQSAADLPQALNCNNSLIQSAAGMPQEYSKVCGKYATGINSNWSKKFELVLALGS